MMQAYFSVVNIFLNASAKIVVINMAFLAYIIRALCSCVEFEKCQFTTYRK